MTRVTSICEKSKCLLTLWQKATDIFWNIWETHINLYDQKESVSCIEVTKIGEKRLVLLILQEYQVSVWVVILVHCMVTFFTKTLAKF